ncbi:hypothetical protein [Empedobacter sp. GD03797]|uniref:hypothetical protein n=1 Tax=Empedobacter sp. GD03797 TaxID=2975382 RepID=UPI00244D7B57|nr:hypothetical protein [Empedobacter sp. GD03797]MDH1884098.1 hypothetical protein [Empedobacter sp. GD03797]
MKYLIILIITLFFTNCKKNINHNNSNKDFIVSKFNEKHNKLIEAIINQDSAYFSSDPEMLMPEPIDKKINLNYNIGNIHFMIIDTSTSYFYINSLDSKFKCGGTGFYTEMSKQDSINYIIENSKHIHLSKKIKTNQIPEIINKYKKEILNNNGIPLTISFSSKYDTVKGEIIPNIFSYLKQNGMNYYFIRRFNEAEHNANFK